MYQKHFLSCHNFKDIKMQMIIRSCVLGMFRKLDYPHTENKIEKSPFELMQLQDFKRLDLCLYPEMYLSPPRTECFLYS